jgi:hypothetical protein
MTGITTLAHHPALYQSNRRNRSTNPTERTDCKNNGEQPVQLGQVRDLGGAGLGQLGQELAPDSPEESLSSPAFGRPGWLCTSLMPSTAQAR